MYSYFYFNLLNCFVNVQEQKEEKQRRGTFLIVSPSSILFNWEDELNTWGYFKTGRFHGASKNETLDKARNGTLEVVLTTYETYRIHIVSSSISLL